MPGLDPVTSYAEDVVSGLIPAGKFHRLSCERHLDDLKNGASRGIYWDVEKASKAIRFFGFLQHSKGEWAGQPIELERWQQFIIGCVFGWMRADGTRRFRVVYIEIPRKNGKSTLTAGVGILLMVADGEPGAEIYTAATKLDQAKIIHEEAKRMVKASPALKTRVQVLRNNISYAATHSKYEPLGRDSDTMDGLNPHAALVDELHAHKTRDVWDVLDTATGARRQPLLWAITTAGFDKNSVCWEQRDYSEKLLEGFSAEGGLQDDAHFSFIAAADPGDDWEKEETWRKANPNFGISVKVDDLRRKARKAAATPAALTSFLRLHLNIWTESETRWLDMEKWDACQEMDPAALRGASCWGGLDLASNTDIAAFVLVFHHPDGGFAVLPRFFIPEDSMRARIKRDRVPYDVWVRQGLITATPGEVIDYDWIKEQIKTDAEQYDIKEIAFDRWGSTDIRTAMENDGFTMVMFGQGTKSMWGPSKELERLVIGGDLRHNGNPVLRWMASNTVVEMDSTGSYKPSKKKSTEKIDGIVALCMALDRAQASGGPKTSVYETQGVFFL